MDTLDEELAKLKLLKCRPLSPHNDYGASSTYCADDSSLIPEGKVASLANSFQQSTYISIPKNVLPNGQTKQISPSGISPKKVGPIVPPKPQKQFKSPEVPQSMLVKQVCEPLYSKRLQSNGSRNDGNVQIEPSIGSRPSILNRKQSTYATQNSLYNKMNKVSLDNPAILEQQLEALAHHKMQMEKKGLLQHQGPKSSSFGSAIASSASIPKLSTASYLNDLKQCNGVNNHVKGSDGELSNIIYSNLCASPISPAKTSSDSDMRSANVYSNIALSDNHVFGNVPTDAGRVGSGVYHNLLYENDTVLDLPPPPPAVFSATNHDSTKYLKNQNDDEIPPPPSPVSSSYSELRRATDIFSKNPAPVTNQQQPSHVSNIRTEGEVQTSNMYYPHYVENPNTGKSIAMGQQNYMNMTYNNEYGSYNDSPSLQSISQGSSDYYGYGSFSQGSSTYESIYEPINPPSQLSARSNYLLYVQYINGAQAAEGSNAGSSLNISSLTAANSSENPNISVEVGSGNKHMTEKQHNPKEAEVEALTDFLVHSMDPSNDADSYGVCVKCNDRVVGENSGCTAMDQVYHISCFTCSQCQINLQGKPFYALEGNPYCEYDYLQTLEKCSVCMKPILERILRATGKPYHPQCFTCVVCGNSLDGIPFTVDATNQNYCIADFHKKFAPRCCVCKQPIMPEQGQEETVRVVALDRSFHFECYKCEDCGLLLSSEAEGRGCYPLDDHVLCKSCNAKRVQMLTNRMTTEL